MGRRHRSFAARWRRRAWSTTVYAAPCSLSATTFAAAGGVLITDSEQDQLQVHQHQQQVFEVERVLSFLSSEQKVTDDEYAYFYENMSNRWEDADDMSLVSPADSSKETEIAQIKANLKALEDEYKAHNAQLAAENAKLKIHVSQLQAHKEHVWKNKCRRVTFSPMPPIAEEAEKETEKTSEKHTNSASPSHLQPVHGFAIGSEVITHSLKTEYMNGLIGQVGQATGDRVAVDFRFFLGVKAIRPENLSIAPAMSERSIFERAKAAHARCRVGDEDRPHDTCGKNEHPQKNPTSSFFSSLSSVTDKVIPSAIKSATMRLGSISKDHSIAEPEMTSAQAYRNIRASLSSTIAIQTSEYIKALQQDNISEPKRPMSAYCLFCTALTTASSSPVEMKKRTQMWHDCPKDLKEALEEHASLEKQEYEAAKARWLDPDDPPCRLCGKNCCC